ncbi:MAG: CBS domain-containing protein [Azoarcus sp.]|nr:CBS domain-containing protein [Azoarcus sp.]
MDDTDSRNKPSLLERLVTLLTPGPENRDEIVTFLRSAFERELLDTDALSIVEGALQISEMRACDIMVPRARMSVLHVETPIEEIAALAIKTAHSRFPVIDGDRDDVIGILLAKDLLRYFAGQAFKLKEMLRPAMFIPESKPLNVLLREFRLSHRHMAIVVDEYGGVAGLVTIEDVLEQIVGEIEDESDSDEHDGNIVADRDGRYRVRATTTIGDFNAAFNTAFSDEDVDTIGGLLIRRLGRLPRHGESTIIDGWCFRVLRADSRRLYALLVERAAQSAEAGFRSATA